MKGNWHRLPCVLVAVISHRTFWSGSSRGGVESGNVVFIAGGDVAGGVLAGEVTVNGGV